MVGGEVDDSDCPLAQHIQLSARMAAVFLAATSKSLESALHDGLTCPRTMFRGMSACFRLHSTARVVVKAGSRSETISRAARGSSGSGGRVQSDACQDPTGRC